MASPLPMRAVSCCIWVNCLFYKKSPSCNRAQTRQQKRVIQPGLYTWIICLKIHCIASCFSEKAYYFIKVLGFGRRRGQDVIPFSAVCSGGMPIDISPMMKPD